MKLPLTVTSKVYVILSSYTGGVILSTSAFSGSDGYTCLGEHEITLDVPQEDPTPKIIESLENRAEDIQAEASAAVRKIMEQVQSLRCLEHKPGEES